MPKAKHTAINLDDINAKTVLQLGESVTVVCAGLHREEVCEQFYTALLWPDRNEAQPIWVWFGRYGSKN